MEQQNWLEKWIGQNLDVLNMFCVLWVQSLDSVIMDFCVTILQNDICYWMIQFEFHSMENCSILQHFNSWNTEFFAVVSNLVATVQPRTQCVADLTFTTNSDSLNAPRLSVIWWKAFFWFRESLILLSNSLKIHSISIQQKLRNFWKLL